MPARPRTYVLPPNLEAELLHWGRLTGELPSTIITNLVREFLDGLVIEAEACGLDGPQGGYRDSGTACRFAGLMEARRAVRARRPPS